MQRTRSWKRRSQHNIYATLSEEDEMTRHATYEIPSDNISGAAHETLTAQPNDNIDNITIVVTLPTAAPGQLPKVIHLPNVAPEHGHSTDDSIFYDSTSLKGTTHAEDNEPKDTGTNSN